MRVYVHICGRCEGPDIEDSRDAWTTTENRPSSDRPAVCRLCFLEMSAVAAERGASSGPRGLREIERH